MLQSSTDEAHGISTLFRTGFENLPLDRSLGGSSALN